MTVVGIDIFVGVGSGSLCIEEDRCEAKWKVNDLKCIKIPLQTLGTQVLDNHNLAASTTLTKWRRYIVAGSSLSYAFLLKLVVALDL